MTRVLSIIATTALDIDTLGVDEIVAKGYPWIAHIVSDVPVHVVSGISVTADAEDFVITEFDVVMLAIPADHELSLLGTDVGVAWVSEVKFAG